MIGISLITNITLQLAEVLLQQETIILDGKESADLIKERVAQAVAKLQEQENLSPRLDVIWVGDNPASEIYIRHKEVEAKKVGVRTKVHRLPVDTKPEELFAKIDELNKNKDVNGIILQLPLPLATKDVRLKAMMLIDPLKDADCFNPMNIGLTFLDRANIIPCTGHGVIQMLDAYNIDVKGKRVVVVGTSDIVGKPLALELMNREATVTTCNQYTQNIRDITRAADILIVAIGRAKYFGRDYVSPNCIVIDVGINKVANIKYNQELHEQVQLMGIDYVVDKYASQHNLNSVKARKEVKQLIKKDFTCGDVDFEALNGHVAMLSKVPGGVGLLTVANLLQNTLACTLLQYRLSFEKYGFENHFYNHKYSSYF